MSKLGAAAIAITALITLVAVAASTAEPRDPFSGRWRPDTQTIAFSKTRLFINLDDTGFARSTGTPPETKTPADGKFHRIKADGYVDSIAVWIVSEDEVREIDKLKERLVYEGRFVLAENGQTMTWFVTSFANATNSPVHSTSTWHRFSGVAKTTHGLAGEWQQTGVSLEEGANDWLFSLSRNSFSNRSPQGSGYAAQIGGPAVPLEGDSSGATVSVVRPDFYTLVERHGLKGVVGGILVLQATEGQSSIKALAIAPKTGEVTSFVLRHVQ